MFYALLLWMMWFTLPGLVLVVSAMLEEVGFSDGVSIVLAIIVSGGFHFLLHRLCRPKKREG